MVLWSLFVLLVSYNLIEFCLCFEFSALKEKTGLAA